MLSNAAKAKNYMGLAEQEFGDRAVAPHAFLPYLLDDGVPEERALAVEFGKKLLALCHTACGLWIQSVGGYAGRNCYG